MNQPATLFDELTLGAIMASTGADLPSARLLLALHRGIVSGDVEIEGQQFIGTPLRDDPASAAAARVVVDTESVWWASFTASGVLREHGATVTVGYAPTKPREFVWDRDIAAVHPVDA